LGDEVKGAMDYDPLAYRTTDLLGLADVHRWGVIKMNRTQSVAEHSFNVAVIAMELAERLGHDDIERDILWWSLIHDAPETLSGDIDGKFKRDYPSVSEAVHEAEAMAFPWFVDEAPNKYTVVNAIVKLADKIEAIQFIRTWGVGGRADSVYHELRKIMAMETVPWAARILEMNESELAGYVNRVMNYSTSDVCNIQDRKTKVPE